MGLRRDRELGMHRRITRRDLLNGISIGTGFFGLQGSFPCLAWPDPNDGTAQQDRPGYYPPTLTGLRGSHPGSFEQAHNLRDGNFWKSAGKSIETGETYDLVVIGGGISGISAAYFWRKQKPETRILILDNHDDFGGHAKRNEFHVGGRMLLVNGGTWAIESPVPYSEVARGLMDDLGIQPAELAKKCYARETYKDLKQGVFFNKETFGSDKLVIGTASDMGNLGLADAERFLATMPLPEEVRRDVLRLETTKEDFFPALSSAEKKDRLTRISYKKYLLDVMKVDPRVVPLYQTQTHGLFGVGIDAVNALDCWALGLPGFKGLKLQAGPHPRMGYTPKGFTRPDNNYIYHFPDGNASIARMLVRRLVPDSAPGNTPEDIVTANLDYSRLDRKASPVRIRLSTIVVSAHHVGDPATSKEVSVTYLRDNKLQSVRAKSVVMACWNMMVPYLCPEFPERQKEALHYGVKVPLVYTSVAIRNWQSFHNLGIRQVSTPGMYHHELGLELAQNVGEFRSPESPDEPIVVRMERTPCLPGLSERDQHRAGRGDLLSTTFETFERNIRDQLGRVLSSGGFDPARDILAITVNRWPHGYAYEYNYLFDPEWPAGQSPCEIARKPFGRIAIANSDVAAAAYTDTAINEAYRAVQELVHS